MIEHSLKLELRDEGLGVGLEVRHCASLRYRRGSLERQRQVLRTVDERRLADKGKSLVPDSTSALPGGNRACELQCGCGQDQRAGRMVGEQAGLNSMLTDGGAPTEDWNPAMAAPRWAIVCGCGDPQGRSDRSVSGPADRHARPGSAGGPHRTMNSESGQPSRQPASIWLR